MTAIYIDKSQGFLYEQLYRYFKNAILTGQIKNNAKLPSKRDLQNDLNISQSTIEAAYNLLLDEGYIYSKERSGYYASDIASLVQIPDEKSFEVEETYEKKYDYDLDFNGIDPSLPIDSALSKTIRDIASDLDEDLYDRHLDGGLYELRAAIAKYLYYERGFKVSANQIYIANSTRALIYELTKAYPKFKFSLEDPGFPGIVNTLKEFKKNYQVFDVLEDGIDLEKIPQNTNIISVTPSHQFPTGLVYPIKKRLDLISWASSKKDRYILEDDYDSEFRYTGIKIPALKSFDVNDRVIYIGNFSKSIAPSIKTSYMVLPKSLVLKNYETNVSYFTQKLIANFIDQGHFEKQLNKMRTASKRKLNILLKALDENNIAYTGQDAGLHVICDFKDREEEILANASKYKIKIYPIKDYYQNKTDDPRYIIGYASISETDLKRACDLLFKKM